MKEDEENTDGTDILHQEEVEMEDATVAQRAVVRKLIAHTLMGHKPSDKDAGEEAYDRQEQLSGNEVEEIEHRHAEELVVVPSPQRERTDDAHEDTADGHH